MKKSLSLFLIFLLLLSAAACTSSPPEEVSNSELNTTSTIDDGGPGLPPVKVTIESDIGMQLLYEGAHCKDKESIDTLQQRKEWKQEFKFNYSRNALKTLWEGIQSLPLPALKNVPDNEGYALHYHPSTDFYDFIYLAGGWQYRIQYTKKPFKMISVSDPPALTGRFFGQELRFQKLVDRPYDYQATLIHGDYYVNFLIGSVPSAEKRDPLFLEFSDDPWMTIDEKGTLQLHMSPEK